MYVAKTDGVGISVYAQSRDQNTHRRLTLISELRRGLDENQFFLEYQPILHLRTSLIIGVEALVRWKHPQHGRVLPGNFIHMAEQTGLINPLTTIVLETAIREWSRQPTRPAAHRVGQPVAAHAARSDAAAAHRRDARRVQRAARLAGARDHREHPDVRPGPVDGLPQAAAMRWACRIVDRRLRHRLLVAELPAAGCPSTS